MSRVPWKCVNKVVVIPDSPKIVEPVDDAHLDVASLLDAPLTRKVEDSRGVSKEMVALKPIDHLISYTFVVLAVWMVSRGLALCYPLKLSQRV
ncbi:hypothetical protein Nepgr_015398 [Nepenthes gracilis]|uniref:Uncharacterized protein n=1 Tax=Nepenthes gracilis TaxID=150966 RepID=A0AAD3XQC8_NEPGR|nr:hypothetical protein Nepgr_015398 [Nepenthes gracilis]